MTRKTLKVALLQDSHRGSREANLQAIEAGLREAAAAGVEMVLLQELHNGPYFCQRESVDEFDQAETIPGPGTKYRKMHIPDDPAFYEKFYFTPGDLGFEPIHTSVGKLGVLVCWDQWYPEAARLMALAGADLLLYPTAIGWDPNDDQAEKDRQRDAWITVQRGHAVANGLPLLACNRTGHESDPSGVGSGITFWGSSFVAGPQGEFLAQAETQGRALLIVDVDLARSEHVRRIWPFLRDRRIDAYGDLLKRFRD
jgi:N-carbamoylputrescine amidase